MIEVIAHKSIRYMIIERNYRRYSVEVVAQSNETGQVRTSFWISIDGYIIKYKLTDIYNIIYDRELEEFIEKNIDSWVQDYEYFIKDI